MTARFKQCTLAVICGLTFSATLIGGCQKEGTIQPSGAHLDDPRERMGLRHPGNAASNTASATDNDATPAKK